MTVRLAVTAAIFVTPGIRLPPPLTMVTSPVPVHVLALIAAAVALQLLVTVAWARRSALKRRYESSSQPPVFRGSGPPPPPGGEPIYGTPAWMFWGLLCLSAVGLLMMAAVIVHGPSSRHSAEPAPAA